MTLSRVGSNKLSERFLTLTERDRFASSLFAILGALLSVLQQPHLIESEAGRSTMELTTRQDGGTPSRAFAS